MKNIIVIIDDSPNDAWVIKSAIELAQFLNIEIVLCSIISGPVDWSNLSRRSKDKIPETKIANNRARNYLNNLLVHIRTQGVTAKKRLVYSDPINNSSNFDCTEYDFILMTKSFLVNAEPELRNPIISHKHTPLLILNEPINIKAIADVVFSSNFRDLKPATLQIIAILYRFLDINLNLVYINTKLIQENSDISINNMKSIISNNGFKKTGISIFYADRKIQGAELFVTLKGGDLILLECTEDFELAGIEDAKHPLLIIRK